MGSLITAARPSAPEPVETGGTSRPLRVLHVLPDLQIGGGQGVVLQLVGSHDRTRFDPHVAYLRQPAEMAAAFADAGADPVWAWADSRGSVVAVRRLADVVRTRGIDIVHVHSGPDRKYGQLVGALTRRPVVGHLHSPWNHRGTFVPAGAGAMRRMVAAAKGAARDSLERRTVRRYIAAGEQVRAFHLPFAHAPITTVPNGVGIPDVPERSSTALASRRRQLGLPVEGPLLTCVGRLTAGKGQAALVSWLSDLPGKLVLVGDGEDRSALEQHAAIRGVADRVVFLGARGDVADLLAASDVFVFGSETEGLPLSVLEAMATGTPVVAVTLPGLREVIDDGVSGFLVDARDQQTFCARVRALTQDPALAREVGMAGRDVVIERYSGLAMTRQVEAVYRDVASVGARDAGTARQNSS